MYLSLQFRQRQLEGYNKGINIYEEDTKADNQSSIWVIDAVLSDRRSYHRTSDNYVYAYQGSH